MLSSYRGGGHNLVILDLKPHNNYDPTSIIRWVSDILIQNDVICFRSIRQCNDGEHTVIVGVVKQSLLEKDELSVINYLSAGVDRVLPDINSRAYWTNELAQLISGPVKTAAR